MALPKTGLTPNSPQQFVIDAATILTDFKFEGSEFSGKSLGATSGGVKVAIEVNIRKMEVDGGSIMDIKGLNAVESAKCVITAPLKEFTAETLRRSLNGKIEDADSTEAPEGYQKLTTKRLIEDKDYTPVIAVVGTMAGTGKPVIVVAYNCLSTKALELDFQDGNEAIIEQELTAHASIEQANAGEFPWAVYFPGEAEGGE